MSEEFVDVSQLCKMAEACDDAWVIEFLDCFNMSGCYSSVGTVVTFSRESAGMIVKQCLPKMWQDRYGKGFTQNNLLLEFIRDTKHEYSYGDDFQFKNPDLWMGPDAFLMIMASLEIATDVMEAERLVSRWLDQNTDRFQWPGANYYVGGEKWGCAGFSVDFNAETGFRFTVFSDV